MTYPPCYIEMARLQRLNPHSPDDVQFLASGVTILIWESARYFGKREAMMADPTGDSTGAALRLDFDCRLLASAYPSKMLAFRLILGHLLVWTAPDGIKRARMRSL